MTQIGVRIWGLYTVLKGEREGEKSTYVKKLLFRRGGERSVMRKQMTFLKDLQALGRIDGRYDSFVTISVWVVLPTSSPRLDLLGGWVGGWGVGVGEYYDN